MLCGVCLLVPLLREVLGPCEQDPENMKISKQRCTPWERQEIDLKLTKQGEENCGCYRSMGGALN